MANYILNGWGNKELWVLSNATWVIWDEKDCLLTGDRVSGGYGEREFANILNNDWRFTIATGVLVTPQYPRGLDRQFFLDGDPKPIIFRHNYDDPEDGYTSFYIIYDGNIKDSKTVPEDDFYSLEIYRLRNVYYFTNFGLSFDYGSKKKPVKLKLVTCEKNYSSYWWNLLWWYTKAKQNYAFIM